MDPFTPSLPFIALTLLVRGQEAPVKDPVLIVLETPAFVNLWNAEQFCKTKTGQQNRN